MHKFFLTKFSYIYYQFMRLYNLMLEEFSPNKLGEFVQLFCYHQQEDEIKRLAGSDVL